MKLWSDTRTCLDESDRDVATTLERLSDRLASSTTMLLALEKLSGVLESSVSTLADITTRHDNTLEAIKTRLENQSNILRKITQQNVSRDTRVQHVEGNLALVHGSVNTFNAKLLGLRTTTDTATSTLRNDVNDLRARIIPNLRRDLIAEIQQSTHAKAWVGDDAMARLPNDRRDQDLRQPTVDRTDTPDDICPPPAATTDANVDSDCAASHAGANSANDTGGNSTARGVNSADENSANSPARGMYANSTYAPDNGPSNNPRVCFHNFRSPPCDNYDTQSRDNAQYVNPGTNPTPRTQVDGTGYRSRFKGSRPPSLDTTNIPKGGRILTPRASDRERLARELKTSHFDMASLAHLDYHGGTDGLSELTIKFIHESGYDSISVEASKDILLCYNDIILVHRKVVTGWTNYRTGRSGPTVEYILEKALVNFPRLHSLEARAAVDFYDKLQKLSAGYLLPLMPFNAIKLSFNFEGLCPPGLGTLWYAEVGSAFMDILPRILPNTKSEVTSAIATVGFESNNGYDLLWRILELTVPGFDPTVPILPPTWHRDSDVFNFCQAHLLYFRLQAKKNNYFDARTRISIFLRAIADSKYADIATLLQAQVSSFRNTNDDGYLPHHLRLSGIATIINTNAKARIRDFATPRVNKALGAGYNWVMPSGSVYDWDTVDES
jgi:hypothetical protein